MRKFYTVVILLFFVSYSFAQNSQTDKLVSKEILIKELTPVQKGDSFFVRPNIIFSQKKSFLTNIFRFLGVATAAYGIHHQSEQVGKNRSSTKMNILPEVGLGIFLTAPKLAEVTGNRKAYLQYYYYDKNLKLIATNIVEINRRILKKNNGYIAGSIIKEDGFLKAIIVSDNKSFDDYMAPEINIISEKKNEADDEQSAKLKFFNLHIIKQTKPDLLLQPFKIGKPFLTTSNNFLINHFEITNNKLRGTLTMIKTPSHQGSGSDGLDNGYNSDNDDGDDGEGGGGYDDGNDNGNDGGFGDGDDDGSIYDQVDAPDASDYFDDIDREGGLAYIYNYDGKNGTVTYTYDDVSNTWSIASWSGDYDPTTPSVTSPTIVSAASAPQSFISESGNTGYYITSNGSEILTYQFTPKTQTWNLTGGRPTNFTAPVATLTPTLPGDYFNSNGQLVTHVGGTSNNIYIHSSDGFYYLLTAFPLTAANQQIISNVVSYYARQVGISSTIGVSNDPDGLGSDTAAAFTVGTSIYLNNIGGHLNKYVSNVYDLENFLIHEKQHAQDHANNPNYVTTLVRHANIYLIQCQDPTFAKTDTGFQKGIVGEFCQYLMHIYSDPTGAGYSTDTQGFNAILNFITQFNQTNTAHVTISLPPNAFSGNISAWSMLFVLANGKQYTVNYDDTLSDD